MLEQAIENYPPGTIVESIFGRKIYTIRDSNHYVYSKTTRNIAAFVVEKTDTKDNSISIHDDSRGWSKIIFKPVFNYEIY